MSAPDPRLKELFDAAEKLIEEGGSIGNRTRLKNALEAFPPELLNLPVPPTGLRFSPHTEAVIQRAGELASASNDRYLRTHHLEFALQEIAPATIQTTQHLIERPTNQ